jgi:hypothetical protein
MSPIGLHETDAKAFLGVTDKRWRVLKADGIVQPLAILGSYSVDELKLLVEVLRANPMASREDLKGLIKNHGNTTSRRTVHQGQEGQGNGRDQQADFRLRAKPRGRGGGSRPEGRSVHPLDE